jgi:hypothetical protein
MYVGDKARNSSYICPCWKIWDLINRRLIQIVSKLCAVRPKAITRWEVTALYASTAEAKVMSDSSVVNETRGASSGAAAGRAGAVCTYTKYSERH